MNEQKLIFVYNAESSLFSMVTDFAHKILAPSTYQCRLCALTYGSFAMKQEWKSFIEHLLIKSTFLHKDEFETQYKIEASLPAVFISENGVIEEIISSSELENCQSLQELKRMVIEKLKKYVQYNHPNIQ